MTCSHYIKTGLVSTIAYTGVIIYAFASAQMAHAAPALQLSTPASIQSAAVTGFTAHGDFVKKKKSIKGDWKIVQENSQTILRLSDDFKTSNGPDLKIFLSPQTIDAVTGKTATNGAVLLDALSSTKGGQDYVIPAGVNLANFSSVLIHCEAYSVLWGGGAL